MVEKTRKFSTFFWSTSPHVCQQNFFYHYCVEFIIVTKVTSCFVPFFLFIFYFMAQFILKLTQLRRELTTTNKHQKNNLCLWCRRANRMDDENKLSSICLSSRAREFITRWTCQLYLMHSMINLMCILAPIQRPFWVCLWIIWRFIEVICADENGIF